MPDTRFPYDDEVRDPYGGDVKNPHDEVGAPAGDEPDAAAEPAPRRRPGRPRKAT